MYSALPVQYCTDSSQWLRPLYTNWHFSALENFKTKVSTIQTLVTNMSRYFSAAAAMWKHFSFPLEGERLTLQKSFSLFFSVLYNTTCLISRTTLKGWASRHLSPKILHASFFIHAASNVPSLAQLHLNTLVLPNTWLDFPLSKWKISIICFLRIQQMREFMTNCVGLCRIVIIRYKWEFFT